MSPFVFIAGIVFASGSALSQRWRPVILCTAFVYVGLTLLVDARHAERTQQIQQADQWLFDHQDDNLNRLIEFVRIRSVSTDPDAREDVLRAAEWIANELRHAGMENVQLLESGGHPSVYAQWLNAPPGALTILLYAHYDVQPEEPVSEWVTKPFEPTLRDGKLYGRGASDDKGSLFSVVSALRAYLKTAGVLPVNVKIFFEGEEEIGSPNLRNILRRYAELLRADIAFSADGGQVAEDIPGLCVSLRGSVALQVNVRVADTDMHSGTYGGGVQNPIHVLTTILDTLRDPESGRVLVDSFYDNVSPLTEEYRRDMDAFPFSVEDQLHPLGVNQSVGETNLTFLERTWGRPSLEIVGISGGFQGEGIKTVLPREAHAKISARIVANQTVENVFNAIESHITKEADKIKGAQVSVTNLKFAAEPIWLPKHSLASRSAAAVLRELYGREPLYPGFGGSIPAVALLKQELSIDTTIFAFALKDENVHAPNEFARVNLLRLGERAYVRLFAELAEQTGYTAEDFSAGKQEL